MLAVWLIAVYFVRLCTAGAANGGLEAALAPSAQALVRKGMEAVQTALACKTHEEERNRLKDAIGVLSPLLHRCNVKVGYSWALRTTVDALFSLYLQPNLATVDSCYKRVERC